MNPHLNALLDANLALRNELLDKQWMLQDAEEKRDAYRAALDAANQPAERGNLDLVLVALLVGFAGGLVYGNTIVAFIERVIR